MTSTFENNMQEFIYNNLKAKLQLLYYDKRSQRWINLPLRNDLKKGTKYRIDANVQHIGGEVPVKNVQIRIANPDPARIQYYKDSKCDEDASGANKVTQVDSPIYSQVMKLHDVTPLSQGPWFMVIDKIVNPQSIANYGIYAEIIPQGCAWDLLYASSLYP